MDESKELMTYSPQGLISQALAQNVPIETLERLMDLSERWDVKQAKSAFLSAFNNFQSQLPEIKRTSKVNYPSKTGGTVNYRFAPLGAITKAIQPLLEKCGLSYRWEFEEAEDKIKCYCIISHIQGHSEKSHMTASKDDSGGKNSIQAIGSARSYLQRYTLIGALGLSTADEDIDGQQPGQQKEEIKEPQTKQDTYIFGLIDKIRAKTKLDDLSKLDSIIGNVEFLDKRKQYIQGFEAKLKLIKSSYVITTKAV